MEPGLLWPGILCWAVLAVRSVNASHLRGVENEDAFSDAKARTSGYRIQDNRDRRRGRT